MPAMLTHSLNRRRRGATLIWACLVMMAIIGFVGLTLDTGLGYMTGSQLQDAADASSLAAVQELGEELEVLQAAAITIGAKNYASAETVLLRLNPQNAADGDIVVGIYDRSTRTFTPTLANPNAVKVVARRNADSLGGPLPLVFGPIFGVNTINIERAAIAMAEASSGGAGVIVLNKDDPRALDMDSNSRIVVINGGIHVNSSDGEALYMDSNSEIAADWMDVSGGAEFRSNANVDDVDAFREGAPQISDPLAGLALPSLGPDLGQVRVYDDDRRTIGPGYYSGGILLDSNSKLTLNPGVYILDGKGLQILSNARLYGENVTLVIVNDNNSNSDMFVDSNGTVEITPPETGPYAGVSVFQSPDNDNDAFIYSNGNIDISGTSYFPGNRLVLDSNGSEFSFRVIADKVRMYNDATIGVDYTDDAPVGPTKVFLVE